MISALVWVEKGKAKENPEKVILTDEEFQRIQAELQVQLSLAKDQEPEETTIVPEQINVDKDIRELYQLDDYDETKVETSMFSNIKGLQFYESNEQDPYIKLGEEDEEEERDELRIDPLDNLLIACKTEDDVSHLEVYVYEQDQDNLFVHHDIMLPSFPLCLEWMDFKMGSKLNQPGTGNYVAVGTFDPQVEIWDLDLIDNVFPSVILGQIPDANTNITSSKKKHGPARVAKRPQAKRHVDAVMSIGWNSVHRNLIATGSADTTVKLWDLQNPSEAVMSFAHHNDKVQAVVWNKHEPSVLLTGGYDKKVYCFDTRSQDQHISFTLQADVECIKFDPFKSERFYVSSEDGIVSCYDIRNKKAIFTLHAHDSAVSALDINPGLDGFLVTGSADKQVKLWSLKDDKPKCLASKNLDAGKIFSTTFCTDSPFVVAVAGSKGKVVVWNTEGNHAIKKLYPDRQFGDRPEVIQLEEIEEIDDEDDEEDDEMNEDDFEEEMEGDHV